MIKVKSLDDPLPQSGWRSFQVPGTVDGYNYERAWFRRTFKVDTEWQGQRLILHFGGVKYNSRILVNGEHVGGHFNGYDAFEVDITDAVQWGEDNLLQVGVHDWTGVFSSSDIDLQPYADDWEGLRVAPADNILAPIGGLFTYYGVWDSVTLKVVPAVHIDSFSIRPSLRENRLGVLTTVTNDSDSPFNGTLEGRIFPWNDAGRDENGQWLLQGHAAADFPSLAVDLKPGETQTFAFSMENPPLRSWSPYDPQLYVLEFGFNQPEGDAVRERFGWREFYVQGDDFYLNGKKVHLLAASWWPERNRCTREQITAQLRSLKAANVVAFRTHTQPWQEICYEVADEVGMMMIPEGAIWNDDISYRINASASGRTMPIT